jgi:hypothetical protein
MLRIIKNNALNYEYHFSSTSKIEIEKLAVKKLKEIRKLHGKIQKNEMKFDENQKMYFKTIFVQY